MEEQREKEFLDAFAHYADMLFRHAYFRLSDREVAVDLTQDAFMKAWEYARGGREILHWKSFLYRVLNNLIVDRYRRKKEKSLDALLEDDLAETSAFIAVDSRSEIEERTDDKLLIEKVESHFPELSLPQRTVLTLRYIDGFSVKEIAETLGTSENVISVRIHRAVERLKKLCLPDI